MRQKVAVIVITHNGRKHLQECFESLEKQTYRHFEAYLLDNGSTDASSEFVKERFPWVKIIKLEKNYGFAKGYNIAIQQVDAELVALLNDDTKADPQWLEELVKAIESDARIFAVGSKIVFYDKPNVINHAGGFLTIVGAGIDHGIFQRDSPEFSKPKYVGCVCGAAMLVRRDIFLKLGGFDETYFAYFEDTDLCWRAWLSGYKSLYVPSSKVLHKHGGSWGSRKNPVRIYLGTKNMALNVIKNFSIKNMLIGFLAYIILLVIRSILFIFKSKKDETIALIFALKSLYKSWKKAFKKRAIIQEKRILSDLELRKLGLLYSFSKSIKAFIDEVHEILQR